jgi:hypothetical protein
LIDDEIEDSCSAIPGAMVAFVTLVGTHTPYCYLQFRDHNLLTEQTVSLWMLLQLHEVLHSANYELGSEHRLSPSFVLQMKKMQESAHRSFLASVQTFARVRKLQANTPGIRLNARINLR